MQKGHFIDFETFKKAEKLNISSLDELLFYQEVTEDLKKEKKGK